MAVLADWRASHASVKAKSISWRRAMIDQPNEKTYFLTSFKFLECLHIPHTSIEDPYFYPGVIAHGCIPISQTKFIAIMEKVTDLLSWLPNMQKIP